MYVYYLGPLVRYSQLIYYIRGTVVRACVGLSCRGIDFRVYAKPFWFSSSSSSSSSPLFFLFNGRVCEGILRSSHTLDKRGGWTGEGWMNNNKTGLLSRKNLHTIFQGKENLSPPSAPQLVAIYIDVHAHTPCQRRFDSIQFPIRVLLLRRGSNTTTTTTAEEAEEEEKRISIEGTMNAITHGRTGRVLLLQFMGLARRT